MYNLINRIKLIFLAVFATISIAIVVYHVGWVRPARQCEIEQRGWWDSAGRVCAKPILISDVTGRTITDKAAEAEARKAIGRSAPRPPSPPKP